MSKLTVLLGLYHPKARKFDKAVKKATDKSIKSGKEVIFMAQDSLTRYENDLACGALRYTRNSDEVFSVVKLGKSLIGKKAYRIWSGGKHGKLCSEVTIKGLTIKSEEVLLETQANFSAKEKNPVRRYLSSKDLGRTWFFDSDLCLRAIERGQ